MSDLIIYKAGIQDCEMYFKWANDPLVRNQSYDTKSIEYHEHEKWFKERINDPSFYFYIFDNQEHQKVGQVRITKYSDDLAIIGVSVDNMYRGNSYASEMLDLASNVFLKENPHYSIHAYIKSHNMASIYSFQKANFIFEKDLIYKNEHSVLYIKKIEQCK